MIKKIGLSLLICMASALAIILIGIWWPLENIEPPSIPKSILIQSVNIVDVDSGKILSDRSVWIKDNRIVKIDSGMATIASAELTINGKGKYLIPGLWDMHTHSSKLSPWIHHPLLIANGVTSIRDMSGHLGRDDSYWAGTSDRTYWNNQMELGNIVSPRYPLHSSYQINGKNSVPDGYPEFFKMERTSDVHELLKFYRKEGSDFIKVYSEIDPLVYRDLAMIAPEYDIYVAGHKPLGVPLHDAVINGQRSFEHARIFLFECYPLASDLVSSPDPVNTYRQHKPKMIAEFDTLKAITLMRLMAEYQAHWVPTLQTLKSSALSDDSIFLANEHVRFIPRMQKKLWWNPDMNNASRYNMSNEGNGINKRLLELSKYLVGVAQKEGVPIMAGTDLTDSYTFPGISLHDELEELVNCGLSPLEALRSATIIPSKFSGYTDLGTVDENMLADIILLTANPLKDISNTQSIEAVILNGSYYSNESLNELKMQSEDIISSWHLNVKYLYKLLSSPLFRKQLAD
ncbi:amidohydrolase family protein [Ekhidna sp.]